MAPGRARWLGHRSSAHWLSSLPPPSHSALRHPSAELCGCHWGAGGCLPRAGGFGCGDCGGHCAAHGAPAPAAGDAGAGGRAWRLVVSGDCVAPVCLLPCTASQYPMHLAQLRQMSLARRSGAAASWPTATSGSGATRLWPRRRRLCWGTTPRSRARWPSSGRPRRRGSGRCLLRSEWWGQNRARPAAGMLGVGSVATALVGGCVAASVCSNRSCVTGSSAEYRAALCI